MTDPIAQLRSTQVPPAEAARIRALVQQAADLIAPVWPLERFVACNPLLGLLEQPFETAVAEGRRLFGGAGYIRLSQYQADLRAGRIDRGHLERAFANRFPGNGQTTRIGARDLNTRTALWERLVSGDGTETLPDAALNAAARRALGHAPVAPADGGGDSVSAGADRPAATWVDRQTVKTCASFLDAGLAAVPMPNRRRGLYAAWRTLAPHDPELSHGASGQARALLEALPERPEAVISVALKRFVQGGHDAQRDLLIRYLAALPGWAGYIKQRHAEGGDPKAPADLVGFLGVRFALTLLAQAAPPTEGTGEASAAEDGAAEAVTARRAARLVAVASRAGLMPEDLDAAAPTAMATLIESVVDVSDDALAAVYLQAVEESYREGLMARLAPRALTAAPERGRPAAQLVFCIDVRSEVLRRHLEREGAYQTVGYAGFFGLPLRYHGGPDDPTHSHCPVLLSAKHEIAEAPRAERLTDAHAVGQRRARNRSARAVFGALKGNIAAAFGLVEGIGALSGAAMAGRTVAPRGVQRLATRLLGDTRLAGAFRPALRLQRDAADRRRLWGLSVAEQVFYAHAMFNLTGMGQPFGRLMVICGHGSTTTNNPYAAALDCGACGGRRGGPNARVMAAILNAPEVRARLSEHGIEIPDDTIAMAGEHDTATDQVTLYDADLIPASHAEDVAALQRALDSAGAKTRRERAARLPGARHDSDARLLQRAHDWAQVRPEWGLAGNAAFLVGPRSWTETVDLRGRCFLHDYTWQSDESGEALTVILTAPMVVAHWINAQYYFSTVDNRAYGSGDKTTQNVVGGIGVMQGNESDLMTGLPWQSVADDEGRPYHTPQRLFTVVVAPRARVAQVIAANEILQQLFDNDWVALEVIDPTTHLRERYAGRATWQPVRAAPAEAELATAP